MENQFDLMESITKLTRMLRRMPKRGGQQSHSMHKALRILIENDGMRAADLAVKLDIRPSSLTNVLKRLEEEEYVNKVKDENDSRAYQIYATEKAKKEFDHQKQQQNELTEQLQSSLAEDEIEAFCLTCGKIISFLESEYPEVSTGIDGQGRHYGGERSYRHDGGKEHRHDSERSHRHDNERSHHHNSERSHHHDGEKEHRYDGEKSRRNGHGEI